MRSALPKVLHPLCGRPMLAHVLAVANALDAVETAVVLAADTIEQVRAVCGEASPAGQPYRYVVQAERLGTAHAVLQARDALRGRTDEVLVLLGDVPLLTPETAGRLLELRRASGALVAQQSGVAISSIVLVSLMRLSIADILKGVNIVF